MYNMMDFIGIKQEKTMIGKEMKFLKRMVIKFLE